MAFAARPALGIGRPQAAFVRLADAQGALSGSPPRRRLRHGRTHDSRRQPRCSTSLGLISPRRPGIARRKATERGVDSSFRVFDALGLETLGDSFDTVIDSGLFHVFDDGDRTRYVTAMNAVLRPDGHLYLMCFSDRQLGDWGPRRVTERELRVTFGSGWRIASLVPDRFEINPGLGTTTAKAWLADIVRLAPGGGAVRLPDARQGRANVGAQTVHAAGSTQRSAGESRERLAAHRLEARGDKVATVVALTVSAPRGRATRDEAGRFDLRSGYGGAHVSIRHPLAGHGQGTQGVTRRSLRG